MRLFIAVNIPDDVQQGIADLQDGLRRVPADVKWVGREHYHLTMKFLGEVDEGSLEALGGAVSAAAEGSGPFEISLAGVGAFPSVNRPRVLWAGIRRGAGELERLAGRLEEACAAAGFARGARPFAAHLTLGRVRSPQNLPALARRIADCSAAEAGSFYARSLDIMRSRLSSRGVQYECMRSVRL